MLGKGPVLSSGAKKFAPVAAFRTMLVQMSYCHATKCFRGLGESAEEHEEFSAGSFFILPPGISFAP